MGTTPNDASKIGTKMGDLRAQLAALDPELRARLDRAGFDAERLVTLAETLRAGGDAATRRNARNRVRGEVTAPTDDELRKLPEAGSAEEARLRAIGEAALAKGELAFCVMAGGMATRMGGVVKALVEAFDGKTFLDLRLAENAAASAKGGRPVPLWLMTSDATDGPIREALAKAKAPDHVATFTQDLGLRLTASGELFVGEDGAPSTYATGHGDLVDAVRRAGLLRKFRERGGKVVWIANLDNLGATIDPVLLGLFLETKKEVMVEVCDKANDRGGIPVHAPSPRGERRLQVLEEFRLPVGFDAATVPVFNTNTFIVEASALEEAQIDWSWFEVEKKVDGKTAVQFERLLQEITSACDAAYVRVPRSGVRARFLPVKDHDELAKRRADIEAVARARHMI